MITDIITDGLLAAIAAVGFGAISYPPRKAFKYIAILAAAGHALRYTLMNYAGIESERLYPALDKLFAALLPYLKI